MTTVVLLTAAGGIIVVLLLILAVLLDSRHELQDLNIRTNQIDRGLIAERNANARWKG